jgi:centrosomal protein CEP250
MELEMRLKEQQIETEAIQAQREEERTQADSTLCQVGS